MSCTSFPLDPRPFILFQGDIGRLRTAVDLSRDAMTNAIDL